MEIKILSAPLLETLKRKKNTIISVTHFNEKLWVIHNKNVGIRYRISYKQFEKDIIGKTKYNELIEQFVNILSEQCGFKVKISLLEATEAGTVDCMLIEEA